MDPAKIYRLGDLQLRIMKMLWERGECSVAQVHHVVGAKDNLAYTTMATMLRKMEARGLVAHRVTGRTFLYHAVVKEEAVTRNMSEHLLDKLFEGSLANLVSHLLNTREVSREELVMIEKLIAQRKKAK